MRRTHSQEIALFFIIVDCLFIIPIIPAALLFVLTFLFIGISAVKSLSSDELRFAVGLFAVGFGLFSIVSFGVHLMLGYFKHYKHCLTAKEIDRLWVKTIIYNSLFFFPAFYVRLQCWLTRRCALEGNYRELSLLTGDSTLFSALTLWWFLAIFMAFSALGSAGRTTSRISPKLNIL